MESVMTAERPLTTYDKIRLTRSAHRATATDYIRHLFTDFTELHGDRRFGDDPAIVAGIAHLFDMPVTVIGIEKGKDAYGRMNHHFGFVGPEGYRKALRLAKEAEKFSRPVIFLVDTQGASCGKSAEERGIGEAIAENLCELGAVRTPTLSLMIGEGGSGGALALAVADEVWMLENAYYSVIAPESCASILFKDPARAPEVSDYLKLTARDLYEMEVVERIVEEPESFAEGELLDAFMEKLRADLYSKMTHLSHEDTDRLLAARYEKYRKIGRYPVYDAAARRRRGWFS